MNFRRFKIVALSFKIVNYDTRPSIVFVLKKNINMLFQKQLFQLKQGINPLNIFTNNSIAFLKLNFLGFIKQMVLKVPQTRACIIYPTLLFAFLFWNCQGQNKQNKTNITMEKQAIYQFKVKDISGRTFDFASLKGKKIMIVNTASKCGLTPQYKDLEALYKKYSSQGFEIVGFPANNFGSQEPGTNAEIASFCQRNYGVSFPMMEKVSVKGSDMCAVYQFLTQKSKNGLEDSEVGWNFQKYLINSKGELEKVVSSRTSPNDSEITYWIKG